ncbi:GMC family oxidoreductase (plasmid) [Streptomyces sp. NBC_00853]|uniref:GMC family oxidoreductase n=1 Tax=Streptomyces sp. NBC_00853 TaxID=2903681 RepID=UPI002F90F72F|nr:GMC family oxidoreductase [Streptomyces sp. NBC_00853]
MISSTIPKRARIVIVGAGLVGLELAKELQCLGVDEVLVLEAGPAGDSRHISAVYDADDALRLWLSPEQDEHFKRTWSSDSAPHFDANSGLRRRLGGRSLYWYGTVLPIEPWALQEPWWPASIVTDLTQSWQGGPSLYDRVAADLGVLDDIHAAALGNSTPTNAVAVGHFNLVPTPRASRNHGGAEDRWSAYSPLDHWRDPDSGHMVRAAEGIIFCCDVEVLSVEVADGAACGVQVRQRSTEVEWSISADAVVLCAGTVENSRLAIGALAHEGAESTRLGGLSDHIVQGFMIKVPTNACGLPPGSYVKRGDEEARSNLFMHVLQMPDDLTVIDVRMTGEQLPEGRNFVECTPGDSARFEANVHVEPSLVDVSLIAKQREVLEGFWSELSDVLNINTSGSALHFADFDQPERTNVFALPETFDVAPQGIPITWSSPLGTEDHEGGTLALGTILSERHEFARMSKLYAAGPSTFPRAGAANPSLTSLALARRLASILAEN